METILSRPQCVNHKIWGDFNKSTSDWNLPPRSVLVHHIICFLKRMSKICLRWLFIIFIVALFLLKWSRSTAIYSIHQKYSYLHKVVLCVMIRPVWRWLLSYPNLGKSRSARFQRFCATTVISIHRWLWYDAQRFEGHKRCAVCFSMTSATIKFQGNRNPKTVDPDVSISRRWLNFQLTDSNEMID